MKPLILFYFTLTVLCFSSLNADELPGDTKELLSKLDAFSEQVLTNAQDEIRKKEAQVITVLAAHLKRETKAGNLKTALSIQAEIDRLKNNKTASVQKGKTDDTKKRPTLESSLRASSTVWFQTRRPEYRLHIDSENDTYFIEVEGERKPAKVTLLDDSTVQIYYGKNTTHVCSLKDEGLWIEGDSKPEWQLEKTK